MIFQMVDQLHLDLVDNFLVLKVVLGQIGHAVHEFATHFLERLDYFSFSGIADLFHRLGVERVNVNFGLSGLRVGPEIFDGL